ncbi:MobF family relaxase [Streptomyces sp. NRRL S-1022]|uniref:MobF family relaxase n=1 Tax=Streptomyces sp. NRRL S-1022 TaxID=1463880 RepID=UPI00099D13AE|nr:MobF family relaxase [Streptomyces sp. NRRL S-1022]
MTATVSPGSDPGYLINQVGKGGEHYYLKSIEQAGEPAGMWLGDGAKDLGLTGEVDHELMSDMYSKFTHPQFHARVRASLSAIIAEPGSDEWKAEVAAVYDAARVGRKPYDYAKSTEEKVAAALEKLGPDATPEQRREAELKVRQNAPSSRSYYDVTFSVPKSYSLLHAGFQIEAQRLREAGDLEGAAAAAAKADAVWEAVMEGVQAGLEFLQEEAGYARDGRHGAKDAEGAPTGRQVDAHRWTIASFRQHTSRDNDPQLHVHNAIWNRVQVEEVDQVTGEVRSKWLTIDGQEIYRHTKAAGHIAEKAWDEALYRKLGIRAAMRPDGMAREIVGISEEKRDKYSSRRRTITKGTAELARAYEDREGRPPGAHELARMAQWVNLAERKGKTAAVPREQLLEQWEADMVADTRESLADIPAQVERASAELEQRAVDLESGLEFDPAKVVRTAVENAQDSKSAWRRGDLIVEITKALPDCLGGLERSQVRALVNELVDAALQSGADTEVVRLTARNLVPLPPELTRDDGLSVYARHGAVRYATKAHLEREGRVIEQATELGAPAVSREAIEAAVAEAGLNEGQEKAFRSILASGRRMEVVAAPAGTGKSRLAGAIHDTWTQQCGPVIGLTVSQRAARVLSEEGVRNAQNIAKFLDVHRRLESGAPVAEDERAAFQLQSGQLILVDEASMAETGQLDEIRRVAARAGAKVLYVGDNAQLDSVGSGGIFSQLTDELPNVHRLDQVMRFKSEWEKRASLRLRQGDAAVLAEYDARGRLRAGTREEMLEASYQFWLADHVAGRDAVLIAPTKEQADELAARARQDLVRLGQVEAEGIELPDRGLTVGKGDMIQLRKNSRRMTTASGERFATNRDVVKVLGIAEDGAVTVAYDDGDTLQLPPEYVQEHVDLAYAGTIHSTQGRTVGTAHSYWDGTGSREAFYVAMTRGRERNTAYMSTDMPGVPAEQRPDPMALYKQTLENSSVEKSATQVQRDEEAWAQSLAKHTFELEDLATEHATTKLGRVLYEELGAERYSELASSEAFGSLIRLGRAAEAAGYDAEGIMRTVAQGRLEDAKDLGKVLHWRAERELEAAERRQVRADEQRVREAVERQEATVNDLMGQLATAPVAHVGHEVSDEAQAEALRQAEVMQQAPILAWNGSQEDALAAQQAVIQAQVIDPAGTQRAAEAAAAEQAQQQAALDQVMAMQLGAEVLHGQQEGQERHRIAEEHRAAAEERTDWRNRVADIEGRKGEYARAVAELAEEKRLELGRQLLEQAEAGELPQWAQQLGPVPDAPEWRERWIERAGTVAAYREAHEHDHERDPIGQRPGRGAVDVRQDWDRAYRALGEPEGRIELVGATDATLRRMVEQYERETEWAPPHVADQLRLVSESVTELQREAVQKLIEAREAEEPARAEELQAAVEGYDALAAQLEEDREALEEVHQARQAWHDHTEDVRAQAQEAQRQLELRAPEPQAAPEALELQEDVQEPTLAPELERPEAGEQERLREAHERAHAEGQPLTREELQQAVQTAARATEILADREQTRQMEEAERARRDEPVVVQQPEQQIEVPEIDPKGHEVGL